MTDPSPELQLHDRLSDALGAHDVHPARAMLIQQAYLSAGGAEAAWGDLPASVQREVEEIEQLPRQSWDDPADVPDGDTTA